MSLSESILIDDCITIILHFLPLRDLLSYGATSIRNLQEIDPHLDQIRRQLVENTMLRGSVSALGKAVMKSSLSISRHLQNDVQSLLSAFPTNLNRTCSSTHGVATSTGQVNVFLSRQRDHLIFHKICRKIILDVISIDRWVNDIESVSNRTKEIPLNRYIGKIICATCLLGHRIHGSPTEIDWIRTVERNLFTSSITVIESSAAWYSLWVMIHSMVLRTVPHPEDQLLLLGIQHRQESHADDNNDISLQIGRTKGMFRFPSSSIVRATVAFLETITKPRELNFRINDFGPLGAFRGRDRFRQVTLTIDHIRVLLLRTTETNDRRGGNMYSEVVRPTLLPFFDVQSQVFKSQPMTVAPPVVALQKYFIS